jgi:hypothetical protein
MKRSLTSIIAIMTMAVLTGCGPSKAWTGQWDLDEAKSSLRGPTFVISVIRAGIYRLDAGTLIYSFACDGKKYPTTPNRFISCTQKDPSAIDSISTVDGSVVEADHWKLSADGTLLSITSTSAGPSGTAMRSTENVFARIGKSIGFAGGWKNLKPFGNRHRILQLALRGDTLHLVHLETGLYADIRLDGSDAPVQGESVLLGTTIGLKPSGSHEFLIRQKVQGRIVNEGSLKLSGDGQALIEEYWVPGSNQKSMLVYERHP